MQLAVKQRDTAIIRQAVANGAEFGRRARAFIIEHLRVHGPAPGEEIVIACKNAGIIPARDDRSFGGAFLSLSKKHIIYKAGSCKRLRGHATQGGIIWSLTQ